MSIYPSPNSGSSQPECNPSADGAPVNWDLPAYELTDSELEGHHPLADLARQAGYSSLRSLLNNCNLWDESLGNLRRALEADNKEGQQ